MTTTAKIKEPDLVVILIVEYTPGKRGAMSIESTDYGLFDKSRPPSGPLAKSGIKHHLIARFASSNEAHQFAALPDLIRALRAVEWGGTDKDEDGNDISCCSACDADQRDHKHNNGCSLAAALKKAGGAS